MKIRNLARKAPPAATSLTKLLSTTRKTGGYRQFMHLIYNTAGAVNGFDTKGHFLRAVLQVTSCTTLVAIPTPGGGCATNWADQGQGATPGATPAAAKAAILQRVQQLEAANGGTSATGGVPLDAQGDAAGASSSSAKPAKSRKPHAPSLSATKDLLEHDHRQARPRQQRRDAVRHLHHSESGAGTMRRGGVGAIASSPVMVGAVTTLIVILAVFLAYNANNGLPFVPSYRISVQVPNAETLLPGNDVRIGGVRVGFVEDVVPVQHKDGRVTAKADLKLDKNVDPIPVGSTVVVRAKSALGLKYLEINRTDSPNGYPEGSTLPLKAANPHPVEYDQVLSMFNGPTRTAVRQNLVEFGAVLAGRGPQINAAIGQLRPLLRRLEPVARNLASSKTGLARFFREAGNAAAEVAPVAQTQAHMFVALDTTFGALASVARPFIQDTITETPPTFDTLIRTSPRISTFLRHNAALFADLRPGVHALNENSPQIAAALETGARVLPDTPSLNAQLAPTAQSLERFATNPDVQGGISRATQTLNYLSPTLQFVTPAQSVCNYRPSSPGTRRACSAWGTESVPASGSSSCRAPVDLTTRRARRPDPPTRPGTRPTREARIQMPTSSIRIPTPTPPRRASLRANAKRATRTTPRASSRSGTRRGIRE